MKYHIISLTIVCEEANSRCNYSMAKKLNCSFCAGPCTATSMMKRCALVRRVLKSIRRGLIAEGQCWLNAIWSLEADGWSCLLRLAIPDQEPLEKIESILSMLVLEVPELRIETSSQPQEMVQTRCNRGVTTSTGSWYHPYYKI